MPGRAKGGSGSALHICVVSDHAKRRARLLRSAKAHVEGVATRIRHVEDLAALRSEEGALPEVLILDCVEQEDVETFLAEDCADVFQHAICIVVCDPSDQYVLQELVMDGLVYDYLPVKDDDYHYLKTQVWRAMRSSVGMSFRREPGPEAARAAVEAVKRVRPAAPVAAPFQYDPTAKPFAGMLALIIEDDLASATLLADYLTLAGFEVLLSNSVGHACRFNRDQPVDVILTGLFLPGVSGPRVVGMLREYFQRPSLPIVVVSAYTDVQIVRACIKEGVSDFLLKPLRRATLIPRLAALLLDGGSGAPDASRAAAGSP